MEVLLVLACIYLLVQAVRLAIDLKRHGRRNDKNIGRF